MMLLLKTIVDKADAQEKKITEMQGILKTASTFAEQVQLIKKEAEGVQTTFRGFSSLTGVMEKLSTRLTENTAMLKQPVTNKVLHHHHVPKIIWIAVGLFIAFALVCSGWYTTALKLDQYQANDKKYRYLKLSGNIFLQQLLLTTDSLYRIDQNLRDTVLQKEEAVRERFELQRLIQEKENELIRLKKKRK